MDLSALNAMNIADLLQLNKDVVAVVRAKQAEAARKKKNEYNIGDYVRFAHKGRSVTLRITGFGPKNLLGEEVDPATGDRKGLAKWRVSPSSDMTKVTINKAKATEPSAPAGSYIPPAPVAPIKGALAGSF